MFLNPKKKIESPKIFTHSTGLMSKRNTIQFNEEFNKKSDKFKQRIHNFSGSVGFLQP